MQCYRASKADVLSNRWQTDPRWQGRLRDYTANDVTGLRGSVHIESTLARSRATLAVAAHRALRTRTWSCHG
jgi:isocitrate lyase